MVRERRLKFSSHCWRSGNGSTPNQGMHCESTGFSENIWTTIHAAGWKQTVHLQFPSNSEVVDKEFMKSLLIIM